jgi:TFIIF-interacting CTD phosphatase-like protein
MKLIKQETGKKSGAKYIYSIIDENGNVLKTRSSNREYVAATCVEHIFLVDWI